MLLRHDCADGVEVLAVSGPLLDADLPSLRSAVEHALAAPARGVVLDLGGVTGLGEGARAGLAELAHLPSGWPRPTLVVAQPPGGIAIGDVVVVPGRDQALARLDDRQELPREVLDLDPGPTSAAHARAAAAACCDRLGVDDDLSDDVVLVVSEMVTNALRHAAPPVALEIEAGEDAVVVAVRDSSPRPPIARDADPDAEGGRGMMLVDLLSEAHGVRAQPPGKAVWARLLRRRSGA